MIIAVLIALCAYPHFYVGSPMLTGNALQHTADGSVITATALLNSDLSVQGYLNKNIKGALENEGYLFIWDYENTLSIYDNDPTGYALHSIQCDHDIESVFYGNGILILQTQNQTLFYSIDSLSVNRLRSPYNMHVSDAAFIRNAICLSAGNGNMIIHVSADTSGIILNDTVFANGTDALMKNNYDILCAFRDTLLEYYIVTDSTIALYSRSNQGRGIRGHRKLNNIFYCWSSEYIYMLKNSLVFEMQCLDSLKFPTQIIDMDIFNDRLHILSSHEQYTTMSDSNLTLTGTSHISDEILSVFTMGNDYLVWTPAGIKYLETDNDSLYMYNDSIIPIKTVGNYVIDRDTVLYYENNDSLHSIKPSTMPVSVYIIGNDIYFADNSYKIYKNDSLVMTTLYPIMSLTDYNGFMTANGYYGFIKRDMTGAVESNAYQGHHCTFIDRAESGIVLATSDYIILADSLLNTVYSLPLSLAGSYRTDSMLYLYVSDDILNDSLNSVLVNNNYKNICSIALGINSGIMVLKDNSLITLHYEMTGLGSPGPDSIDNVKNSNYIVYDIMGRFRGSDKGFNGLKGVYFRSSSGNSEKIIKLQ